jgi:hypothetical protein
MNSRPNCLFVFARIFLIENLFISTILMNNGGKGKINAFLVRCVLSCCRGFLVNGSSSK